MKKILMKNLIKKWFDQKIEYSYCVICLLLGFIMIFAIGTNQVGFDEHIHATTAYNTSFGWVGYDTKATLQMKGLTIPTFYNMKERRQIEQYLNEIHEEDARAVFTQSKFITFQKRSYLPISAGFAIARKLELPFQWMIMLGKMGNFLIYVFVTYFAVKLAKQGKILVAVIALIPNNLFTATSISYDGVVNSFLLLASVLVMNEFLEKEKKLSPKSALPILLSFTIGATAKQIYILMTLPLLFLPNSKFPSMKKSILFKSCIVGICACMLYHVLFPNTTISGVAQITQTLETAGDSRSEGTNVLGQIQYIIGNPLEYSSLLLKSMFSRVFHWFTGADEFLMYGYLGNIGKWFTCLLFITILLASLVTPKSQAIKGMCKKYISLHLIMAFCMCAVVWTSLYLSFTKVGNHTILGVQNRYFIPIFYAVFSCFFNQKIKIPIKKTRYNMFLLGLMLFINVYGIYQLMIVPYYF